LVRQTVQGLVEVFGITPGAHCNQGQQTGVICAVLTVDGVQKAMQLGQGVVQDVAQAVTVGNQPLDGIEPDACVGICGGGVRFLA
jgi:hypothetical protein